MKILFTGGGTLGPVTPLLAVAEVLCKTEQLKNQTTKQQVVQSSSSSVVQLIWVGTRKGPERKLASDAGIKFSWIYAPKWRRYFDARNIFVPLHLILVTLWALLSLVKLSFVRRGTKLSFVRPVIVTAGGFVGVPVVWAGWFLRIPILLHNQDVRWSLANKLVAPFARKITYALPGTIPKRWQKKSVWTGNPVRLSVRKGNREKGLKLCGFCTTPNPSSGRRGNQTISSPARGEVRRGGSNDKDKPTILVIGGGTGAKRLNEIIVEALPELTEKYQIIHLTGRGKSSGLRVTGYGLRERYSAFEFVTREIADLYAAADAVITRAGMGVLCELATLGKPMIIVPLPNTHQEDNARYFENKRAAVVVEQKHLITKLLLEKVEKIFQEFEATQEMRERAQELTRADSAKRVAEEIITLANRRI